MSIQSARPSLSSEWTVLIWGHQSSRLKLVEQVVSVCGASPFLMEEITAIDNLQFSSSCCLAIVALETSPTGDILGLHVIHRLKNLGFSVISHEQGTDSWPIGLRCRALLAGAACLLDSGKTEFAKNLQRTIMGMLERRACEQKEEKK